MRDPDRIGPFLLKLESVWEEYPDLRFGQLIYNIISADGLVESESDERDLAENYEELGDSVVTKALKLDSKLYEFENEDWLRALENFNS